MSKIDRAAENIGLLVIAACVGITVWFIAALRRAWIEDHEEVVWSGVMTAKNFNRYVPSDWEDDWDAQHLN